MKKTISTIIKPFVLGLVALTVMALGRGVANADDVFFSGNTNGCFNANNVTGGCVAGVPPSTIGAYQTATLLGLQYNNATFSGTSASGFLSLGGNPVTGGLNQDNLGSFTLGTAANIYAVGNTFALRVTFVDPQGINGGNSNVYTATVTGVVRSATDGGVTIDFNNTPMFFTFNDTICTPTTVPGQLTTCGQGSFFFTINDLDINPGQTASLTGNFRTAQQTTIPEPATLLLLGTGLTGLGAGLRRRYRASRISNIN